MAFNPKMEMSSEIPPQAYALLMQPQAVEFFGPLEGFNLLSAFYFNMPFMLKKQQTTHLQKNAYKLFTYTGTSLFIGFFTNIQIKRVYLNFLKWPIYARIPIRLGIMSLPFLLCKSMFDEKLDNIWKISIDVTKRKDKLLQTGNIQEYFGVQKDSKKKK